MKASSSRTTISATTSTTILSDNPARTMLAVQNVGTGTCWIKFGLGASATDYSVALAKDSAADQGYGGVYRETEWAGVVTVYSTAGTVLAISEITR